MNRQVCQASLLFVLGTSFVSLGCKGRFSSDEDPPTQSFGGDSGGEAGTGGERSWDGELVVENETWGLVYELFVDGSDLYYATDVDGGKGTIRMRPKDGPVGQGEIVDDWTLEQSDSLFAADAHAVYWLDGRGVARRERATGKVSHIDLPFVTGYGALDGRPEGIWGASDSCKDWFSIDAETLETKSLTVEKEAGMDGGFSMVVADESHIYCAYASFFARAPSDLSALPESVVSLEPFSRIYGVAQDETYAYLLYDLPGGGHRFDRFDKITLERQIVEQSDNSSGLHDLQYHGGRSEFYFTFLGAVRRWTSTSESGDYEIVADTENIYGYALDGDVLYWGGAPGIARVELP